MNQQNLNKHESKSGIWYYSRTYTVNSNIYSKAQVSQAHFK